MIIFGVNWLMTVEGLRIVAKTIKSPFLGCEAEAPNRRSPTNISIGPSIEIELYTTCVYILRSLWDQVTKDNYGRNWILYRVLNHALVLRPSMLDRQDDQLKSRDETEDL